MLSRHGMIHQMVEEIEVETEEASCDVIVTPAHMASGLQRFMLTDTTELIVLGSGRPVTVVRSNAVIPNGSKRVRA